VLEALDTTLIPNAANAELKALLVKVRPAFVAHKRAAQQMQSSLVNSN
jgi:putative membrane protein